MERISPEPETKPRLDGNWTVSGRNTTSAHGTAEPATCEPTTSGKRFPLRRPTIAMVQPAEMLFGDDRTLLWRLDGARNWRVPIEAQMRSAFVIILEEISEDAIQMPLVEDDDVIQAFAADGSDQPFDVRDCQGDLGAVRTSSMPRLLSRCRKTSP